MKRRPVVLRERAAEDIETAMQWYLQEAGETVALRFVDAVERTLVRIARHPGSGSLRYGHELYIAGLRTVVVPGFPHLVFYVEAESHLEVWRVLHGERDLPEYLSRR